MIAFHRLLIGTAIIFCLVFAVWALVAFRAEGGALPLVLGVAFAAAAAGLAYYLKNLRRFLGALMEHTALDQSMFWVGALFVFTPIIFAGIVLGVWWHGRKHRTDQEPQQEPDHPVT